MSVLVTIGDPLGIGPEIIVKALKKIDKEKRKKVIVIGSLSFLKRAGWDSNLCEVLPIEYHTSNKEKNAALISFKSLELACKLAKKGWAKAIVTAPISKKRWFYFKIPYNGHTDYFRKIFKKELIMCFVRKNIVAGLLTEHMALKEIFRYVNKRNIVSKTKMLIDFLKRLKVKEPKVAMSCVNPHCGEDGYYGDEEVRYIMPAIKHLKSRGFNLVGPLNPDDCIKKNINNEVNGSLFFYHDQLIPLIKVMDFNKNDVVHVTHGLDFIRTSPAHGTAQDIAWKGLADETSMKASLELAFKLSYD